MVNKASNSDSSDKFYLPNTPTVKHTPDVSLTEVVTSILKDGEVVELPLDRKLSAKQIDLTEAAAESKVNNLAGQSGVISKEANIVDTKTVMKDIRASLDKTPVTRMSDNDLQVIADYIVKNRAALQEEAKSNPNGVVYKRVGLPRAVQFNADGTVLIHFNKGKLGDKILGKGSYKRVRVAMDFDSKTIYAVARTTIEDVEDRLMTDRETKFLNKMAGKPGIAQIIKEVKVIGKDGQEKSFSIQPIYNKGELFNSIATLTAKEKYKVVLDLLKGFASLEEENVIHRDIKLENIFLQKLPDGQIEAFIADFGLACMADEKDEKEVLAGSSCYIDPERMKARYYHKKTVESVTSHKGDMWSFGVALFAMIHRRYLFDHPTFKETKKELANLYQDPYSLPTGGPTDPILRLMAACLTVKVEDRISGKEALAKFGPELESLTH